VLAGGSAAKAGSHALSGALYGLIAAFGGPPRGSAKGEGVAADSGFGTDREEVAPGFGQIDQRVEALTGDRHITIFHVATRIGC